MATIKCHGCKGSLTAAARHVLFRAFCKKDCYIKHCNKNSILYVLKYIHLSMWWLKSSPLGMRARRLFWQKGFRKGARLPQREAPVAEAPVVPSNAYADD